MSPYGRAKGEYRSVQHTGCRMTRLPGKPSTAHPLALKPLFRRVRSVHRIEYRCKPA